MKKLYVLLFFSFTLNTILATTLNDLGLKYGTDKSSVKHDYLKNYEKYFSDLRNQKIIFLEIEFAGGHSARMWNEYFNKAELYFIDVNNGCYKYFYDLSDRCHLDLVDQASEDDLRRFIGKVEGALILSSMMVGTL